MVRRLAILAVAAIVVVAVAGAGIYGFRRQLAEMVLLDRLRALGVPAPTLRVVELDFGHIRLAALGLGTAGELRADAARIDFDLPGLRAGRVDEVAITGLRIRVDLTGARPPFGSLQPLLSGATGKNGSDIAPLPLPVIGVVDGRVEAATPAGPVTIDLAGEFRPGRDRSFSAAVDLEMASELGRLQGLLGISGRDSRTVTGNLVVDQASLRLPEAAVDGLAGTVDFTVRDGAPESLTARLEFAGATVQGAALGKGHGTLQVTLEAVDFAGALRSGDGALDVTLGIRLTDYRTRPALVLQLNAELGATATIWPLFAPKSPTAGRGTVGLRVAGRLPAGADWPRTPDRLSAWLRRGDLEGQLDLELTDVAYPGWVRGLDGRLGLAAASAGDRLTVTLPAGAAFQVDGLDRERLLAAGLPAELARRLASGLTFDLRGTDVRPFQVAYQAMEQGGEIRLDGGAKLGFAPDATAAITATGTVTIGAEGDVAGLTFPKLDLRVNDLESAGLPVAALHWSGTLAGSPDDIGAAGGLDLALGRIRADRFEVGPVRARLPISLRLAGERLAARLTDPGVVRIEAGAYDDRVALAAPVRIVLTAGSLARADRSAAYIASLAFEASAFDAEVTRPAGDPLVVEVRPGIIRLAGKAAPGRPYQGELQITDAGVRIAEYQLALEDLSAELHLEGADQSARATFQLGALRDLRQPPWFVPLRLDGRAARQAGELSLVADVYLPDGSHLATASARHDLERVRGDLAVQVDRVDFAPAGRQPADFSPALVAVRDTSGTISTTGAARWQDGRVWSQALLELDNLSFTVDDIAVDGLDAKVVFDDLLAPSTPPGQRLTVRRLDPALPIEFVDVSFQLRPGAPLVAVVEQAGFRAAGGIYRISDTAFDLAQPEYELTIEVERLDLAELFRTIAVEGVSAEGVISGDIPLTVGADTFLVRHGRLTADGPGVLRFRSPTAAAALQAGGESVELMLKALENFRFQTLSLTADKGATGDADIKIKLQGHNPDVLDGYPFAFNIGVTSNLATILDAVRRGTGLTQEVIRRALIRQR